MDEKYFDELLKRHSGELPKCIRADPGWKPYPLDEPLLPIYQSYEQYEVVKAECFDNDVGVIIRNDCDGDRQIINEGEFDSWLKRLSTRTLAKPGRIGSLNLVWSHLPAELDVPFEVPFAATRFRSITEMMHLPRSFLRSAQLQEPPMLSEAPLPTSYAKEKNFKGYIFRTNNVNYADRNFNLVMSHDFDTGTTYALLMGIVPRDRTTLIERLKTVSPDEWGPMTLPFLLVEQAVELIPRYTQRYRRILREVDDLLGDRFGIVFQRTQERRASNRTGSVVAEARPKSPDELDYEKLINKLTSAGMNLAYHTFNSNAVNGFLDEISSLAGPPMSSISGASQNFSKSKIEKQIAHMKAIIKSNGHRMTYLEQSSRTSVQTIYNLQTNRIAKLTQRDSAAMTTIAGVTLFFLPATAAATLFSASFFNFSEAPGSHVVTKWIGLYVGVIVFLTASVFIMYNGLLKWRYGMATIDWLGRLISPQSRPTVDGIARQPARASQSRSIIAKRIEACTVEEV